MYHDKKLTKEDTWKADELKKYMRGYEEDVMKRGERMRHSEDDRRHRTGASVDRRHRDHEREERRDRDKHKDREQKERTKPRDFERDRDMDRRREDTREREHRKDRERERGVDIDRYRDVERGSNDKDRRYDRGEKENRDKDRERERYKEKMSEREKEKERERRRAERERERRSERDRRKDEDRDPARDFTRLRLEDKVLETERERRERHRPKDHMKESEYHREGKEKNRERREHSGYREGREHREHRRGKEEEERRQRERDHLGTGERRDLERERHHRENRNSEVRIHSDRDREREKEERDRHREKRHKDELERIKSASQRTSSSRNPKDSRNNGEDQMLLRSQSTWRSSQGDFSDPDTPADHEKETEKPSGENYEEVDYEEDFEDYEDDFEDVDEDYHSSGEEKDDHEEEVLSPQKKEELRAIQRAMDEENERVESSQSRPRTEESLTPRTPRTDTETRGHKSRGVIDFVSAKRREVSKKVSTRQKKRSAELLRLIDLDFSITFSLLDLPPVNEYDMYIKSFGTTNTKQAYVQCNEDNTDREVQTEETDSSDKWTQHPAETSTSCGGPDQSQDALVDTSLRTNFDSRRLVSFLRSATQVMSMLLEEDRAERHAMTRLKTQSDSLSFSDGCLQLNTRLPFLHGRQVSHLHFSDAQRQTLLSAHTPSSTPSAVRLDSQSIICVWNIWEPSRPQKILVYESEITCCCFSPGKATLVFAGTSVGSVVLWDLREPSSTHYNLTIGQSDWTLRYPTFSTDAVLSVPGHLSTVRSVEPVTVPDSEGFRQELPLLANPEESLGLSFQLASLDEKGVLNLWVVVELPKYSDAGSQTDLGLRPGGKVKLLHSSTLQTCDSRSSCHDVSHPGPLQALLFKFLPSDSSHYFIGTNMGVVNHGTRHGLKAPPKFYIPQVAGFRPVQVSCLEFCPNGQPHFLVACDDGSVRLHSVQCEQPLLEWSDSTGGVAVVSIQWALTRPAVFCVLDAASCLHLFDLLEDEKGPVLTEKIDVDRVDTMAVFGDPSKQNTYSGIALAKHSGRIEIHYFRKRFTVPSSADSEKLDSLMRDAF